MRNSRFALALSLCSLAACARRDEEPRAALPPRPEVLKDVPVLGRSLVTDTTGAEDAERVSYLVAVPFDSVVRFYRRVLPEHGWRVVGDLGDSVRLDLHAVKDGPTLWVQVSKLDDRTTTYTLIGSLTGRRSGQ